MPVKIAELYRGARERLAVRDAHAELIEFALCPLKNLFDGPGIELPAERGEMVVVGP